MRQRLVTDGLTLVEVLVVLAIVGLLLSISLPAVQAARESARRAQCSNNLHQVGLAMHTYESGHSTYPPVCVAWAVSTGWARNFSSQVYLLPYIEESKAYATVNFDLPVGPSWEYTGVGPQELQANTTTMSLSVGLFLCPSDPYALPSRNSYRANMGIGLWGRRAGNGGCGKEDGHGAFLLYECLRSRDFTDGLSKTIAFSEKLCAAGPPQFHPETDYVVANSIPCNTIDADLMVANCRSLTYPPAQYYSFGGWTWTIGSTKFTTYTHTGPPNSEFVDCTLSPGAQPPPGAFSARSLHTNTVSCLMVDGAVRFVTSRIDLGVWRALGTRDLGEPIDVEAF